ncbi:MAG: hypothetical protein CL920_23525 [Deltaproteobacteria bacterium]|nr:hypothetical protein [Deltaproteobacteria bacterium]MBU51672.1 hypothetical protein [Deltaproteobacteria bacterium]|tara:strand:- start:1330 stop:3120 length:1791 start_codon:yes stop_codon:yes gene_type:complete
MSTKANLGPSPFSRNVGAWEPGEEGLFWRGPVPPDPKQSPIPGDSWEKDDWIELPHEHYIPVSKFRLNEILWQFPKSKQYRKELKHFLTRIESVYHFHYHGLLNELKNDYEFFDPEAGPRRRKHVDPDELAYRRHRFLKNLMLTMVRGNFVPFSKEFVEKSREYDYLFDLKVRVQWDQHDPSSFRDFADFVRTDEAALELRKHIESDDLYTFLQPHEEFKDNVLLFWRGIDCDKREVSKPLQKLDIWISDIFGKLVFPLQRLIEIVRGERKAGANLITDVMKDVENLAHMVTFGVLDNRSYDYESSEDERSVVFEKRWVRRLNMQNQHIRLRDLFSSKQLQEPELEKMVCVFQTQPKKSLVEGLKARFTKEESNEDDPSIYIKMFKRIPLADAELILPFKKPSMKSFDLTLLMLTGTGSLFALYKGLQSGGKFAIIVMGVLMTLFVRLVMGYLRTLRKYNARMISELYDKNLDNDVGVLQYLIDSIEEQEFKESVLAYYMLWLQDEPMTEKELDAAIEEFLSQYFDDLEVDFEVDDALNKIVFREGERDDHHLPIVEELNINGELHYKALPIEEALEIMDAKWELLNQQRLEAINL